MSFVPPEVQAVLPYAGPPLIGAFIGYLTNHVAIRMLFRPLRAWRICGLRVPMTPGVIPAKRGELAKNMGEVVGEHLLTSDEIARGLDNPIFQAHLRGIIGERLEEIMRRDLGPLGTVIPSKFRVYFDIASKTVIYQAKEKIRLYLASDEFRAIADQALERRMESFLAGEVRTVIAGGQRERVYALIEQTVDRLLHSTALEEWAEDMVRQQVYGVIERRRSLHDLLPGEMEEALRGVVLDQTPALLCRLAAMISEAEVRDRIVAGVSAAVDGFLVTLGPMGEMARGFFPVEQMKEKIGSYLDNRHDEVAAWLTSPAVQARVAAVIGEKCDDLLHKPLAQLFPSENSQVTETFCETAASHLVGILRQMDAAPLLVSLIKNSCETRLEEGGLTLQQAGELLLGSETFATEKLRLRGEVCQALQSPKTFEVVDSLVEGLAAALLQKKIGKLSNIVPQGVREAIVTSIHKAASTMLAEEVPGLVQSLNIKHIVTEKINSLDILRVEGLLLTIMQEQFKYINLFGALLGFLIGCGNLLLL